MIYADSGVIVKRYYQVVGTQAVRDRWAGIERIFTSRVSYAEVHAAFARKYRLRELPAATFHAAAEAFETEWSAYDQIDVAGPALAEIRRLVRRYPLRGYDAIHLAAAMWVREQLGRLIEFWVSDHRLEAAARSEGLAIVNPAD